MAERFHIAEWYGRPFLSLSDTERLECATFRVGGNAMSKADLARLAELASKVFLSEREKVRLASLRAALERQQANERPCPFRTDSAHPTCTKPGGVCSLRLYAEPDGNLSPVDGERGKIRALCPYRFHQNDTVFKAIGRSILGDEAPIKVGEVGFLESTGNLDSAQGEDVGRIDMILVRSDTPNGFPLEWAAVEIQAVYFSGKEMKIEFDHIAALLGHPTMPREIRRPDYRSSGPKRLMPQLQIKVPTLRRWGKKMVIVVDVPFFQSMGEMRTANHPSNADIIWVLVDFVERADSPHLHLEVVGQHATTLENAIEGLTGGTPVTRDQFERRIRDKALRP